MVPSEWQLPLNLTNTSISSLGVRFIFQDSVPHLSVSPPRILGLTYISPAKLPDCFNIIILHKIHFDDTEIWHGVIKNLNVKIHTKLSIKLKTWILFSPLLCLQSKKEGRKEVGREGGREEKKIHLSRGHECHKCHKCHCLLFLPQTSFQKQKGWSHKREVFLGCAKSRLLRTHRL